MAFRVLLVEDAERDIEDIHSYIALSDSPERADRILDALEELCNGLAEPPARGNVPKELRDLGITQYREVHHAPYRVIYQVLGDEVVIHCVLDGRRDMESLLQRRLLR
ncbi:MAG: type II toxin-antitoxin system RelE/ParE family toxin [Proteobacteria bacterium]|nr:type II toxin-antitoxin system RelE/ParE family toxin [Pseudomonadota bacterium]